MKRRHERGTMLVFASFVLLSITIICVAYWRLIEHGTKNVALKQSRIRAFYAARGGIDDAIFELKQGTTWGGAGMSAQWINQGGNTYAKSSTAASNPISNFDVPTTYSVTVVGDPDTGTVNIRSEAEVTVAGTIYRSALETDVVKSIGGEVHILDVKAF